MLEKIKNWFKETFTWENKPLKIEQETIKPKVPKSQKIISGPWADKDVQSLLQLKTDGCTFKQIATYLNRTESSVYQKYLRDSKKKQTPKDK